jgi:hypothetical protein
VEGHRETSEFVFSRRPSSGFQHPVRKNEVLGFLKSLGSLDRGVVLAFSTVNLGKTNAVDLIMKAV